MITVKYKLKDDVLPPVVYGNWIDLYTAEEVELTSGDYRLIDLGIAMEFPKHFEALVVPRSSTFKNYGILMTNSIGIIDDEYNGDQDYWKFPALATRDVTIPKNIRIAQFRIIDSCSIKMNRVKMLGNEDRGGFGSTGTK